MPRKNRENYNAYMRTWRQIKRFEMIDKFGGKCEDCGKNDQEVLSICNIGKTKKLLCHNCRYKILNKKSRVDNKVGIKK